MDDPVVGWGMGGSPWLISSEVMASKGWAEDSDAPAAHEGTVRVKTVAPATAAMVCVVICLCVRVRVCGRCGLAREGIGVPDRKVGNVGVHVD